MSRRRNADHVHLQEHATRLSHEIRDTYGDDAYSVLLYTHTHGPYQEQAMVVYTARGVVCTPRHYGENPNDLMMRADTLYGDGHWTLEPASGVTCTDTPALHQAQASDDLDALPWPTS